MGYYIRVYIYIGVLSLSVLLGLIKFKQLDKGGRLICLLLLLTLLSECTAFTFAHYKGNNMVVYHIYNPMQFFILSLYFNNTVEIFRKKNIGVYIGLAGILVSIINTAFLQPLIKFNTYYLLFEGVCIISMCLFAFYQLMLKDSVASPIRDPHFRISFLLLFYWCVTFISWGVYEIMLTQKRTAVIGIILLTANIILYLGIAIVFLLYKRKPAIIEHV